MNIVTKTSKIIYAVIGVIDLLLILLCVSLNRKVNNLETDINVKEQNIKSLNDSIRFGKNKNGDLEYSKGILILENDELKKLRPEIYEIVKKLEGKVSELTQTSINVRDTGKYVTTTKDVKKDVTDGLTKYSFDWKVDTIYNNNKNNYLKFNGQTSLTLDGSNMVGQNIINNTEFGLEVYQGIREKDGLIEVFTISNHPNFKVTELNSVIINPKDHVAKEFITQKKKQWNISAFGGYGVNSKLKTDVFIGVGIGKTIFAF